MTEDLRVDTGLVRDAGGRLQGIAADIPQPPTVYRPAGADALSTAVAAKVAEIVDPVIAQLPIVKEELSKYAQNVVSAANTYDSVDRQLAESILQRVKAFDDLFGSDNNSGSGATGGPSGGGGATGGAPGGAAAPSPSSAASPSGAGTASPAASGAQQPGQLGQMMQMPMQMAQQAAQVPMQMAGMAGAAAQAIQQAVQQGVQQATQLAGNAGNEEAKDGEANSPDDPKDAAAPGASGGERTPESLAPPHPGSSEDTLPTEPGPEIAL